MTTAQHRSNRKSPDLNSSCRSSDCFRKTTPVSGYDLFSEKALWFFLFCFAFGLRLVYLYHSRANPLFGYPVVDALSYDEWATLMARGEWLWYYVHNYLPIYPAFLALQKILWGGAPWINKLLQNFMGALTVVFMARIARVVWDRRTGLITGLLLATNWMLVVFASEKYAESFALFFLSLSLWLLICTRHRLRTLVPAGLSFALAAGSRANLFLLWPFIIFWLLSIQRSRPVSAAKNGLLFALGVILLIGPMVYRNYQISGAPLLRAQPGWSFYSALAPRYGGLHPPPGAKFRKEIRRPFREGLRSEVAIEKFWFRQAWEALRNDSLSVVKTQLNRLLVFCNARQWSQEFDVYAYRNYSALLRLTAPLFWLLIPLGILGLFLVRRESCEAGKFLLVMCLLLSVVSIFPFKASDRYRLPTLVLLTPLAAYALRSIMERMQKRQYRSLLAAAAGLTALLLLCWPDWPDIEERKTARHDYFIGLAHQDAGRESQAICAFQRSLQNHPWDPDSPYHLARILIRQDRMEQACSYLWMALAREPNFPEALVELAAIAMRNGENRKAEGYLTRSLRLHPHYIDGFLLAARLCRKTGDFEQEDAYYRRAVAEAHFPSVRAARFADIALERSLRLAERGKSGDALAQLDEIIATPEVRKGKKAVAALIAGGLAAREKRLRGDSHRYWQALLSGSPRNSFPWCTAAFMMDFSRNSEFAAYLETLTDKGQKVFGYYILGLGYRQLGRPEQARRSFGKCLLLAPGETDPLFCAGQQGAWQALHAN